jgi:hypothetical protein
MNSAVDQFLDHYFFRYPVNATFTGVRLHDHELPDWSREGREDAQDERDALLLALEEEHPPTEDWGLLARVPSALDAELARAALDVQTLEHESRHFHDRNPALWTGEAIFGVVALLLRPPANIRDAFASVAMRLHELPRFLGDLPATLTEPMPAAWVARALRECAAGVTLFRSGLPRWLDDHGADAESRAWVLEAGEAGVQALEEAAAWLRAQPAGDDAGMALGAEGYGVLLRRGHFCQEEPAALLQQALQAFAPARARLEALAAEVAGSVAELAEALADDHPTAEELLPALAERWEACRAMAEEQALVEWGDWPLRYVPIPAWAAEVAPQLYFLFYRSPAPLEPRAEHVSLVTPVDDTVPPDERARRLRQWNHSALTLNHVVHHGGLGHHVQNWHAVHRSTSRIGTIAAVDCASRIGLFLGGSMAEGWACYATDLAEACGLLTPLEQASEQQARVRQLGRAIVDLSLHTGVMTPAQGVAFFEEAVAMPRAAAEAEVLKASMFPATAVMYWLGTEGILALRERLRARQGGRFSLRDFHGALLRRGSIPVPLAARLLEAEA